MPDNLIDLIPKPLLEDLVRGRWIPLIGAGFSRNAVTPDDKPPVDWIGLGKSLAGELGVPEDDQSPIELVSEYEQRFGRARLVDRVSELIRIHDASPSTSHHSFARLGFETVVTTNFDFLLERAYEAEGKPALPVVEESQWSARNPYKGPRLIKLHGDIHHPAGLVLSEDDYDNFLRERALTATSVTAMFVDHSPILIGYSLDDPDLRQIFALIKQRLGNLARPAWALQVGAPPRALARYARRGVRVVNLPKPRGQSYNDVLTRLFEELGEYSRRGVLREGKSTDERAAAELSTPNVASLICYFAIPLEWMGWYREFVFPLVEARGFVPMAARDFVTPPGTALTKLDALVDSAALVVVDISDPAEAEYELALALRREDQSTVLLVRPGNARPAVARSNRHTLIRPGFESEDSADFMQAFDNWLSNSLPTNDTRRRTEPSRLYELGEYRAALISAVALLDSTLRRADGYFGKSTQPISFSRQVADAFFSTNLGPDVLAQVEEAIRVRNSAVHENAAVTRAQARQAIDAIRRLLVELQPQSRI